MHILPEITEGVSVFGAYESSPAQLTATVRREHDLIKERCWTPAAKDRHIGGHGDGSDCAWYDCMAFCGPTDTVLISFA